jgi:putative FmdB family regulatory protein
MPLYEYQCEACGVRFERRQSFSDNPVKECPECGGKVHRLIQTPGIVFKGSGFYVTDNRSSSSTMAPSKRSTDKEDAADSTKPSSETNDSD